MAHKTFISPNSCRAAVVFAVVSLICQNSALAQAPGYDPSGNAGQAASDPSALYSFAPPPFPITAKSPVKPAVKSPTGNAAASTGTNGGTKSTSPEQGNNKSVSMASPLAPPQQPMIDTTLTTPGQPKPAHPNAAPPGGRYAPGAPATPGALGLPMPVGTPMGAPGGLSNPYQPAGGAPGVPPVGGALYATPGVGAPQTPQTTQNGAAGGGMPEDNYPVIGTLETSIFGAAAPAVRIEDRLSKLESTVYKKTYEKESLFDRTERLKATVMGMPQPDQDPTGSHFLESANSATASYLDSIAALPENQVEVPPEELQRYFFTLVNGERQKFGFGALTNDDIAQALAKEHATELCKRHVLSHSDTKGNNPDRRYTLAGGTDLLYESIVSINNDTGAVKPNRAIAVNLLKTILNRQDEREALLSSDATGLGFAIDWTKEKDKIVACSDVLTRHGVMAPIPNVVQVGDKIEVKGVIMPPFHFDRITVAWEGKTPGLSSVADDSEEALPYFAPLDYSAYAHHSDNDHSGTVTVLKTAGIIAAIAGGVFIPPVALAAPLIAMSGSNGEPKPASDIPVKGGVKVDGNAFDGKVAINHEGKEGYYYITVWASLTKYGKPIAISRRAILATSGTEQPAPANGISDADKSTEPNKPDAEKVSAERVNDDGTPAPPIPIKGKHKQKKNHSDSSK